MEKKTGNKKMKTLFRAGMVVMAAVMLLCGTYFATVALLNRQTEEVINTFEQPTNLAKSLLIVERLPKDTGNKANGIMDTSDAYDTAEVNGATYLYVPGVELGKRAYVKIDSLNENAYLFLRVKTTGDDFGEKKLTWSVDTANWTKLKETDEGTVYYHNLGILAAGSSYNADGKATNMDIIKDDKVTVSSEIYEVQNGHDDTASELIFSAFLVQATGFPSAEDAWSNSGF